MKRLSIFLLVTLCALSVFAADYEIESCSVNVSVGRDAVHDVTEDYVFNYMGPHHGFFRYIPEKYTQGSDRRNVKISSIQCSDPFGTSHDDGFLVIQIGSSSRTYTGLKAYTLSYLYDIGEDRNEGYDEFYFNLAGDGWEVPIRNFSWSVDIPCKASEAKIWVTYGKYGSTQQLPFTVADNGNSITVSGSASGIFPGQALTIRVQLPEGWYEGARKAWDYRTLFTTVGFVASLLLAALAFICWSVYGRDRIPAVYARFEAPDGLSPLPVGYVADRRVDDKDITSMLYYWADAGYLTIAEPKKDMFEFTKLRDLPSGVPQFEKRLFNGFFRSGDKVTLKSLQKSMFYRTVEETRLSVKDYFSKDRALEDSKSVTLSVVFRLLSLVPMVLFTLGMTFSESTLDDLVFLLAFSVVPAVLNVAVFDWIVRKWYLRKSNLPACIAGALPSIAALFVLGILTGGTQMDFLFLLVSVLCSAAVGFLGTIMPRRSEYGNRLLEEILGYREFIEKVSVDELKRMIKDNPDYYYKVLSYAIVLGLEEKWARKFASITLEPPRWYTGNYMLDAWFFSSMAARMSTAVRLNAMPSAPRGSRSTGGGGFNMSGFAGGGFGGGGGRAW